MFDQLIIGKVYSGDDFDATVASRRIGKPKKKSIKESVPFSNIVHDFSAINGEIYWEERELEYDFEIIADSPEELEEKKAPFLAWIMNVMNEKLHDPYIPDYHFIATFADIEDDDSEIEKSNITVKFTAYPYMIANEPRVLSFPLTTTAAEIRVKNESAHKIVPTLTPSVSCTITAGASTYALMANAPKTMNEFALSSGVNVFAVKSNSSDGVLRITFVEEVF